MRVALLGCAIAMGAIGCGGASHPTHPVPCTIVLSGAVTGSYACAAQTAAWAASDNVGAVAFSYGTGGPGPVFTASVGALGQLHAGTFTDADAGAVSALSITEGTALWLASIGSGAPHVGSYSMVLTEVDVLVTNATGSGYTVHGTLDASLPAASGTAASGTITVHVSF